MNENDTRKILPVAAKVYARFLEELGCDGGIIDITDDKWRIIVQRKDERIYMEGDIDDV